MGKIKLEFYDEKLSVLSHFIIGETLGKTDYLNSEQIRVLIGLLDSQPLHIDAGLYYLHNLGISLDLNKNTVDHTYPDLSVPGKSNSPQYLEVKPFSTVSMCYTNTQIVAGYASSFEKYSGSEMSNLVLKLSLIAADRLSSKQYTELNQYHLGAYPNSRIRFIPVRSIKSTLRATRQLMKTAKLINHEKL